MKTANPLENRHAHNPALCFFALLLAYNFVVILRCAPPAITINYTHYAVDFSFGFCSRLLPGAVYNLFVSKPTETTANIYMYILMLLFLAAVSLLLERLLLSLPEKERPLCLLLLAFYLTGPATFSPHIWALGLLDFHWLVLMVPFFLLMQHKWGRLLLPLFPFLLILTSFGAAICWVPFCGLLILYEFTLATNKKTRRQLAAVFFAAVLTAAGTTLYFATNETKNLKYTLEEFNEILDSRGVKVMNYYDATFYGDMAAAERFYIEKHGEKNNPFSSGVVDKDTFYNDPNATGMQKIINTLRTRLAQHWFIYSDQNYIQLKKTLLFFGLLLTVLLPPACVFYSVLRAKWKAARGDGARRFLYFCLQAFFPLLVLVSLIISIDSTRWLMHAFMMLFTFLLYAVFREGEAALAPLRQTLRRIPRFALFLYYGIYCFTFVSPYVYA